MSYDVKINVYNNIPHDKQLDWMQTIVLTERDNPLYYLNTNERLYNFDELSKEYKKLEFIEMIRIDTKEVLGRLIYTDGEVSCLFVHPLYRGNGFGKDLIEFCKARHDKFETYTKYDDVRSLFRYLNLKEFKMGDSEYTGFLYENETYL